MALKAVNGILVAASTICGSLTHRASVPSLACFISQCLHKLTPVALAFMMHHSLSLAGLKDYKKSLIDLHSVAHDVKELASISAAHLVYLP
jgi:hypothetical protein